MQCHAKIKVKNLLSVVLTLLLTHSFAQLHVGYYHDLDKLPIFDFVHPFEYNPDSKLQLTHYSDSYENGVVYRNDGSKEKGQIKYKNKKIWFKPTGSSEDLKLKPEDVQGLTIGLDSFFVATNFNVEKKVGPDFQTQPQFMQYIATHDDMVFAKHYFFSSGMAQQYTMASPIIETYQVIKGNSAQWKSFPRRKNEFKTMALAYFGHIPYLKKRIEDETIGFEDVNALIKTAEYLEYLENDELIHFDRFWNETQDKENSTYQVKIRSLINDSIWTFDYFKNQQPLYRVRYSELFPHKKHGNFEILGAQGFPTQVTEYKDNEKSSRKTSFPDGTIHYHQFFQKVPVSTYREEEGTITIYLEVNDKAGKSLLDGGNAKEKLNYKQGTFVSEIALGKLKSSYREEDGRKIYQIVDRDYNFKLQKMQNLLSTHFSNSTFREAAELSAQGIYLITVVISDKGRVQKLEVHNSLLPDLDSKITSWAAYNLGNKTYGMKFKPYRVNGEKVYAEFVIPLQFSVSKFYRKPANYYYDWGWHNMMFQQQMMMQPMNLPAPPPMPRF